MEQNVSIEFIEFEKTVEAEFNSIVARKEFEKIPALFEETRFPLDAIKVTNSEGEIYDCLYCTNKSFRKALNGNINGLADIISERCPMICPEKGEFLAYKYVVSNEVHDPSNICIATLVIPHDADRSNSFGRKCRASKAVVKEIKEYTDAEKFVGTHRKALSWFMNNWAIRFPYNVGDEVVSTDGFDKNRWTECGKGIHFFMTFQEAFDFGYFLTKVTR